MWSRLLVALWGIAAVTLAVAGTAGGSDVDLTALIHETQRMLQDSGQVTMVWWVPDAFWETTFRKNKNKNMTASQIEGFLKVVRPYTVIAVFDGTVGPFGGITYKSGEQIRDAICLVDAQDTSYKPRTDDEINADLKNLLTMMKPMIANMLGPLGQNMHFFVFPGTTEAERRIADPKGKGHFGIKLGDREHKWRLPLDSLLPVKTCTGCGESCKGSWNFCPWCGTKLMQE